MSMTTSAQQDRLANLLTQIVDNERVTTQTRVEAAKALAMFDQAHATQRMARALEEVSGTLRRKL